MNGLSSRASCLCVSGRPRVHSAHGRSGSATNAATKSAEEVASLSPNAFLISARSSTLIEDDSCPSPESRQAASRARCGHRPPTRSAMASRGRQLSAARSFNSSGTSGSGSVSFSKLSAAQRADRRRKVANSSLSRFRSRATRPPSACVGGLRQSPGPRACRRARGSWQ